MEKTYLNGKITLSSLAAPSDEDIQKINALSDEDRNALLHEALEASDHSPISDASVDDIWDSAVKRAEKLAQYFRRTKISSR